MSELTQPPFDTRDPDPTPDTRATVELLTRLGELQNAFVEAESEDATSEAAIDIVKLVPFIIRDLRRLVEAEAEAKAAKELLQGLTLDPTLPEHLRMNAHKVLGAVLKTTRDRDAGWDAAEALAGACQPLLSALENPERYYQEWRLGKKIEDWISIRREVLAVLDAALAAFAAARAKRNPNPEGRT